MQPQLFARLKPAPTGEPPKSFLDRLQLLDDRKTEQLVNDLGQARLPLQPLVANGRDPGFSPEAYQPLDTALQQLAAGGFLEFRTGQAEAAVTLIPCSPSYRLQAPVTIRARQWRLSRFSYWYRDEAEMIVRNPQAYCFLKVHDPALTTLLFGLTSARPFGEHSFPQTLAGQAEAVLYALVSAKIIVPCDDEGVCEEEKNDSLRQWDFHDLLFHSRSRLGRSEKPTGGTFRFKGVIPPQPAVKQHAWHETVIPLPVPNLHDLYHRDMPLTAAIESRFSNRQHSIVPMSIGQLGEFLYRTARIRRVFQTELGEFTSRPYPGGGANYEIELYLTINACRGVERGFYYYDALKHCLCLVSKPNENTENLLNEAFLATAGQCRPQILITMASRFNRFNWKYQGMSYAAQLKNIGVLYQTFYLVATAMHLAPCGLGLGNTDRFCELTGLDYLEEGSIGEFMLGQPLF